MRGQLIRRYFNPFADISGLCINSRSECVFRVKRADQIVSPGSNISDLCNFFNSNISYFTESNCFFLIVKIFFYKRINYCLPPESCRPVFDVNCALFLVSNRLSATNDICLNTAAASLIDKKHKVYKLFFEIVVGLRFRSNIRLIYVLLNARVTISTHCHREYVYWIQAF